MQRGGRITFRSVLRLNTASRATQSSTYTIIDSASLEPFDSHVMGAIAGVIIGTPGEKKTGIFEQISSHRQVFKKQTDPTLDYTYHFVDLRF